MKRDANKPARSTNNRRPDGKNEQSPEARPEDDRTFPDPAIDAQTEKMTGPPRRKV